MSDLNDHDRGFQKEHPRVVHNIIVIPSQSSLQSSRRSSLESIGKVDDESENWHQTDADSINYDKPSTYAGSYNGMENSNFQFHDLSELSRVKQGHSATGANEIPRASSLSGIKSENSQEELNLDQVLSHTNFSNYENHQEEDKIHETENDSNYKTEKTGNCIPNEIIPPSNEKMHEGICSSNGSESIPSTDLLALQRKSESAQTHSHSTKDCYPVSRRENLERGNDNVKSQLSYSDMNETMVAFHGKPPLVPDSTSSALSSVLSSLTETNDYNWPGFRADHDESKSNQELVSDYGSGSAAMPALIRSTPRERAERLSAALLSVDKLMESLPEISSPPSNNVLSNSRGNSFRSASVSVENDRKRAGSTEDGDMRLTSSNENELESVEAQIQNLLRKKAQLLKSKVEKEPTSAIAEGIRSRSASLTSSNRLTLPSVTSISRPQAKAGGVTISTVDSSVEVVPAASPEGPSPDEGKRGDLMTVSDLMDSRDSLPQAEPTLIYDAHTVQSTKPGTPLELEKPLSTVDAPRSGESSSLVSDTTSSEEIKLMKVYNSEGLLVGYIQPPSQPSQSSLLSSSFSSVSGAIKSVLGARSRSSSLELDIASRRNSITNSIANAIPSSSLSATSSISHHRRSSQSNEGVNRGIRCGSTARILDPGASIKFIPTTSTLSADEEVSAAPAPSSYPGKAVRGSSSSSLSCGFTAHGGEDVRRSAINASQGLVSSALKKELTEPFDLSVASVESVSSHYSRTLQTLLANSVVPDTDEFSSEARARAHPPPPSSPNKHVLSSESERVLNMDSHDGYHNPGITHVSQSVLPSVASISPLKPKVQLLFNNNNKGSSVSSGSGIDEKNGAFIAFSPNRIQANDFGFTGPMVIHSNDTLPVNVGSKTVIPDTSTLRYGLDFASPPRSLGLNPPSYPALISTQSSISSSTSTQITEKQLAAIRPADTRKVLATISDKKTPYVGALKTYSLEPEDELKPMFSSTAHLGLGSSHRDDHKSTINISGSADGRLRKSYTNVNEHRQDLINRYNSNAHPDESAIGILHEQLTFATASISRRSPSLKSAEALVRSVPSFGPSGNMNQTRGSPSTGKGVSTERSIQGSRSFSISPPTLPFLSGTRRSPSDFHPNHSSVGTAASSRIYRTSPGAPRVSARTTLSQEERDAIFLRAGQRLSTATGTVSSDRSTRSSPRANSLRSSPYAKPVAPGFKTRYH